MKYLAFGLVILVAFIIKPHPQLIDDWGYIEPVTALSAIKAVKYPTVGKMAQVAPQNSPQTLRVPSGNCRDWIVQAGIEDVENAYDLIMRESGCRVDATNASSGAFGIPQSLPANKMASAGPDWQTNPITQLKWMDNYCLVRYGSWAAANQFQAQNNWY